MSMQTFLLDMPVPVCVWEMPEVDVGNPKSLSTLFRQGIPVKPRAHYCS